MAKKDKDTTMITPELLIRYIKNDVDFDEWLAVVAAERKYEHVRGIIGKMRREFEKTPAENPRSREVCSIVEMWKGDKQEKKDVWLFQHFELPVECLAAKNDSNDCVIRCEQFILEKYGIRRSLIDLKTDAEVEGWCNNEGTPLYHIGRIIENSEAPEGVRFSLARFTRASMTMEPMAQLRHELETGCHVILAISQSGLEPDHAIVVTGVSSDMVEIFDPSEGFQTSTMTHGQLLEKWKFSHYFMVSITLRGRRPYTPHPEDLSDIILDEEINALVPALMENAHDVWAKGRQAKGWKYGEEKNDDLKLTPFMLPYLEMKDKDKETDRLTVVNTLKLLIKMGYKIVKRYDTNFVFNSNQRKADGEYIANPIDLESVNLPENIIVLREYIAENVHEDWSLQRFKEGWVYGDKTDDEKKINKDLVPYCELLESEKQYDRNMAYDTLRLLYKMGYVIEKNKE